jgi:chitin synthase
MVGRWIMVGVFGIYIVPLLTYAFLFRSMRPLVEAIKNALSFIFYNPTYFIILSFYALCRIDDISWGTKGLN